MGLIIQAILLLSLAAVFASSLEDGIDAGAIASAGAKDSVGIPMDVAHGERVKRGGFPATQTRQRRSSRGRRHKGKHDTESSSESQEPRGHRRRSRDKKGGCGGPNCG